MPDPIERAIAKLRELGWTDDRLLKFKSDPAVQQDAITALTGAGWSTDELQAINPVKLGIFAPLAPLAPKKPSGVGSVWTDLQARGASATTQGTPAKPIAPFDAPVKPDVTRVATTPAQPMSFGDVLGAALGYGKAVVSAPIGMAKDVGETAMNLAAPPWSQGLEPEAVAAQQQKQKEALERTGELIVGGAAAAGAAAAVSNPIGAAALAFGAFTGADAVMDIAQRTLRGELDENQASSELLMVPGAMLYAGAIGAPFGLFSAALRSRGVQPEMELPELPVWRGVWQQERPVRGLLPPAPETRIGPARQLARPATEVAPAITQEQASMLRAAGYNDAQIQAFAAASMPDAAVQTAAKKAPGTDIDRVLATEVTAPSEAVKPPYTPENLFRNMEQRLGPPEDIIFKDNIALALRLGNPKGGLAKVEEAARFIAKGVLSSPNPREALLQTLDHLDEMRDLAPWMSEPGMSDHLYEVMLELDPLLPMLPASGPDVANVLDEIRSGKLEAIFDLPIPEEQPKPMSQDSFLDRLERETAAERRVIWETAQNPLIIYQSGLGIPADKAEVAKARGEEADPTLLPGERYGPQVRVGDKKDKFTSDLYAQGQSMAGPTGAGFTTGTGLDALPLENFSIDPDVAMMAITGEGKVGAKMDPSLVQKLGASMYQAGLGRTIIKEGLQNAFDALVDPVSGVDIPGEISVEIEVDQLEPTVSETGEETKSYGLHIRFTDTGMGMTPEVAANPFMDIGGSFKAGERPRGSFGMAKVGLFSQARHFIMSTVAVTPEGKKQTRIEGSGLDWINGEASYKVDDVPADTPTGTTLFISIPAGDKPWKATEAVDALKKFILLSSPGKTKLTGKYRMTDAYYSEFGGERDFTDVLQSGFRGPNMLAENGIDLTVPPDIEKTFDGGIMRVWASNKPGQFGGEAFVRNNGLYQFAMTYPSENAPAMLVIDVTPTVPTTDQNYPFTTSREQLRGAALAASGEIISRYKALAAAKRAAQLRRSLIEATPIGPGLKIVEMQGGYPEKLVESIANSRYVASLAGAAQRAITTIANTVQQLISDIPALSHLEFTEFSYSGFSLDKGALGVNIHARAINDAIKEAREESGAQLDLIPDANIILISPWSIAREMVVDLGVLEDGGFSLRHNLADRPSYAASVLAKQTINTLIHEVIHEAARGHDATFSGILTRVLDTAEALPKDVFSELRKAWLKVLSDPNFQEHVVDLQEAYKDVDKDIFEGIAVEQKSTRGNAGGRPAGGDQAGANLPAPIGNPPAVGGPGTAVAGGGGTGRSGPPSAPPDVPGAGGPAKRQPLGFTRPGAYTAAVNKLLGNISIGERRTAKAPITWDRFVRFTFDDLHPINQAVKYLVSMRNATIAAIDKARVLKGTAIEKRDPRAPIQPKLLTGQRAQISASLEPLHRGLLGIEDAYIMAYMAKGSHGAAIGVLEGYGPFDIRANMPYPDAEPLKAVFDDVRAYAKKVGRPDSDVVDEWRAILVSPRTLELAGRPGADPTQIPFDPEAARIVMENAPDELVSAALRFYKYYDQLLRMEVDAGVISPRLQALFQMVNPYYVPFAHFLQGVPVVSYHQLSGNRYANLYRIEKPIGPQPGKVIDPLEKGIKDTFARVHLAYRQQVMNALIDLAEQVPGQELLERVDPEIRIPDRVKEWARVLKARGISLPKDLVDELALVYAPYTVKSEAGAVPKGIIWAWRGGERVFYKVPEDLYRALLVLDAPEIGVWTKLMGGFTRVFKAGVTLNPAFPGRNIPRDWQTAATYGGVIPLVGTARGIASVIRQDALFDQWRMSGAELSFFLENNTERIREQEHMISMLTQKHRLKDLFFNRSPVLHQLEWMSATAEMGTRIGAFARARARGLDPHSAGYFSLEATLNFRRVGAGFRGLNMVSAFLNAGNLLPLYKALETARNPKERWGALGRAFAYLGVGSVMLALYNTGDPDYEELPLDQRNRAWHFRPRDPLTGKPMTESYFTIPRDPIIGGLFATLPEHFISWLFKNQKMSFNELLDTMLAPFDIYAWVPNIIRPAAEIFSNKTLRGLDPWPVIAESKKGLLSEFQASESVGQTARWLGMATHTSPAKWEAYVRGYGGGLGLIALRLSDVALRESGLLQNAPEFVQRNTRLPEESSWWRSLRVSFNVPEPTINSRSVERFYTRYEAYAKSHASLNMLYNEGFYGDANWLLSKTIQHEELAYVQFAAAKKAIDTYRSLIDMVRQNPNMSDDMKRAQITNYGRAIRLTAAQMLQADDQMQQAVHLRRQQGAASAPGVTVVPH